ncbi:MAG: DEAD/DEAH box helicase [Clostridia bacterium]|nr:DEAD/DEAH box helicase [Clostridia bacterium]
MWKELGINEKIQRALIECGYKSPTEIQQKSIKSILLGNDFVGGSATGSGKTLAFALPAIQKINMEEKGIEVLIVCPTRELAIQVCDETKKVANKVDKNLKVVPVYGGADFTRQAGQLIKGAKIVVGTPGRILDHITRKSLKLKNCKMLILDEADEMLSMGFRPDIENIIAKFKSKPQMLLFSATMPKDILMLIDRYLQQPKYAMIESANKPSENVTQYYIKASKSGKIDCLTALVKKVKNDKALIFCNTKAMTENISSHLKKLGYESDMLNGDMNQQIRRKVLESFKQGKLQFLVCTDVASRGIDINNLPYVINYDLPKINEWYIHRIGRTGRNDKKGKAYTIVNRDDQIEQLMNLAKELKISINEIQLDLSDANLSSVKVANGNKINNKKQSKLKNVNDNKINAKNPKNTDKTKGLSLAKDANSKKNKKVKRQEENASKGISVDKKKVEQINKNSKPEKRNKNDESKDKKLKSRQEKKIGKYNDFDFEGMTLDDFYELFKDDMKNSSFNNKKKK